MEVLATYVENGLTTNTQFYYKTLDGDQSGYWDKDSAKWVDMGSKLSNEIESAIDIANRQAPPNFINLPVSPLENN